MTESNFGRCGKLHTLDWLLFLSYVPFLNLRLVLKLSNESQNHVDLILGDWAEIDSKSHVN